MILTQQEFQKRCEEVFEIYEGEECYGIEVDNDEVVIHMGEVGTKQEGFRWVYFDYKPDMNERPQALAYLLGMRNSFAD